MFLCSGPGVVEYLSNGGVADNHKDFKELRYNECLTNFSCNGKNGNADGSITHSFQLKSAYDSNLMPYTNYTYDFKVEAQRPNVFDADLTKAFLSPAAQNKALTENTGLSCK